MAQLQATAEALLGLLMNSWKGSLSRTETGSETRQTRTQGNGNRALQYYRNSVGNPLAGECTVGSLLAGALVGSGPAVAVGDGGKEL